MLTAIVYFIGGIFTVTLSTGHTKKWAKSVEIESEKKEEEIPLKVLKMATAV